MMANVGTAGSGGSEPWYRARLFRLFVIDPGLCAAFKTIDGSSNNLPVNCRR
jgi:hypothetical protein